MNLKVNKETVRSNEIICDCSQEQPIELDYVLPDYYPEIFRIVKCTAEPKITSCAVSGDRVTYELTVCLKVIYCSEGSGRPQAVDQKLTYSRTVNLEHPSLSPCAYITAAADHISCRAVNRRRIDIRGAVTIQICVSGERETDVICEAFGGNIQLKKTACPCPSGIIRAQKRVTVSDEFELGGDAPAIGSILRAAAEIISSDKKIISNKAAAKGELKIFFTYTAAEGSGIEDSVNSMQFTLPFSQLTELEGLDETYDCRISASVISCDLTPRSDGDGEARKIECDILLLISCTAVKMSIYDIACDEYSTSNESSHSSLPVKIEKEPIETDETIIVRGVCENKDSPLSTIYDAWCSTVRLRASVSEGSLIAAGNVQLSVMGRAENGDFVICETDIPVEERIPLGSGSEATSVSGEADIQISFPVMNCTYTITTDSKAEIKAEIGVRGWICDYETVNAITVITVDEDSPREKNDEYALRLYFAESGEELWDIAKKYGASISAVIDENELESDVIKDGKMLLIPC